MNPRVRKQTLRMFSNGVYIITSASGDRFGGATVTWISQASFRPPLLMAAIRKDSNVFRCMQESQVAAIHLVGRDQTDVAQRFFAPTKVENGCMNVEPFTLGTTSAPILVNAPAYVECRVRRMVDEQAIYSTSGKRIPCQVDSICVHGDGPTAVTVSRAVREGLEAAGIRVVPLPELPSLKH